MTKIYHFKNTVMCDQITEQKVQEIIKKANDLFDYTVEVVESYSEEFVNGMDHSFDDSEVENNWIAKLYEKEVQPEEASKIIERAYDIFIHTDEQSEKKCHYCGKSCEKYFCSKECLKSDLND